uniref:Uncharacterized protein n=1 Tax=Cannabis sativa TaxID=3483 RepID=A0A803P9D7_CANSA
MLRGEDAENLHDGIDDDQNPEVREEEVDDDDYVIDGYYKDESGDNPLVEVMAEECALWKIKIETSNPHKDRVSQPSKTYKATGTFKPGCPSAPRGKTMLKGQCMRVPRPRVQKNHPSDTINQDRKKTNGHSEDSCSTVTTTKWVFSFPFFNPFYKKRS